MADDLNDEWWTENADDVPGTGGDSSSAEDNGVEKQSSKKGVKRRAPSGNEEGSDDEPACKIPGLDKTQKRKKKKGRGKFVRKKITGVDEAMLKKSGTPADVKAMLKSSIVASKSDVSTAESDEDGSSGADDSLSLESDFFPANQLHSSDEYLSETLPGWQIAVEKAKPPPGSPLLLILCSSAVRAVQLNRDIKSFLGRECKTAKLFAKHMKLEEQKKFLTKKVCHACIGTPNRVYALLEDGSLKLNQLHCVVLDWNWRDVKLKRMVDIPDVRRDLAVLLKDYAGDHIRHSPCRIAIL